MAHFIWPVARRGKTGDWCWRHPELKLGDGSRPGSSTFKTQQVQRLTVFKQKFLPRIKWSPQTFEELQKAQFDWFHWALTHPWYKLLTSKSYIKKCDLYRSEDHQIRAGVIRLLGGAWCWEETTQKPLEKQEGLWPKSSCQPLKAFFACQELSTFIHILNDYS